MNSNKTIVSISMKGYIRFTFILLGFEVGADDLTFCFVWGS
jgi:hypothetical protein